jgi:hypothetical protein
MSPHRFLIVVSVVMGCTLVPAPKSSTSRCSALQSEANQCLAPNVLLLVDSSGSMKLPVDASAPQCPANCGTGQQDAVECPEECPTRWTQMKTAVSNLVTTRPDLRFGLAFFPRDAVCGGRFTELDVAFPATDDPKDLQRAADGVRLAFEVKTPMGGTPLTAAFQSVRDLSQNIDASDRENVVVLVTDGLPNCNPNHPATTLAQCRCQLASCGQEQNILKVGCLDDSGSAHELMQLRADGTRTAVVGFGAEVSGSESQSVLEDLARLGGFSERHFYADDEASLSEALTSVCEQL